MIKQSAGAHHRLEASLRVSRRSPATRLAGCAWHSECCWCPTLVSAMHMLQLVRRAPCSPPPRQAGDQGPSVAAGHLPCYPHALIACLSCCLQPLMLRICVGACKVLYCASFLLLAPPHVKHYLCNLQARSSEAAPWPWGSNADQLACCLQGLTLNEPEVVPFRLTQNMIDAFGVAGVEGVFRKTCEVSLEVRRVLCKEAPPCSSCFCG